MSAIGPDSEFGPDLETDEAQEYFKAVEAMFSRVRGSALELSPRDREIAVAWFRRGIPREFVATVVPELLAKRRERNPKARWNSLRYCASAVESAWTEIEALGTAGRVVATPIFAIGPRLEALASQLSERLPDRLDWQRRIVSLQGSSERVEDHLANLDLELLAALEQGLTADERARLEHELARTVTHLASRLPPADLEAARNQLLRRELRRHFRQPVLSLFSPEAEPEST